ncbi:unnamed protein product [Rotaria sordida]|uniref:Uncharacterized protein n=1 Tax=Rotaria sordida TaxID=392033 RepID=A0A814GS48_9BILA|nr:unnamed protein product [Rotaria sordida]CAF3601191.1 unnamed protein product [Rotaria sordida]
MSGLRKSLPIHKPITTIDQNLEDEDDEKVFVTSKYRKMTPPIVLTKCPLTDDYDAQETITPKKKQTKEKNHQQLQKTSLYFSKKSTTKKATAKSKGKRLRNTNNLSNDKNATLSNGTYSLTIKTMVNNEVEVKLTSDEVAGTQGKRKKNLNSKEH